jgi:hypothetical protein
VKISTTEKQLQQKQKQNKTNVLELTTVLNEAKLHFSCATYRHNI